MSILKLIGRSKPLFDDDISDQNEKLKDLVQKSRFLVIGGAGSIGQAVTREIFKRNPLSLHVVDISENNMVELVRDIRSTLGYIDGEFKTFAIDCGSIEFEALMRSSKTYDYVLNLSARFHIRTGAHGGMMISPMRIRQDRLDWTVSIYKHTYIYIYI